MNNKKIFILTVLLFHTSFVYLDDGSGIGRRIQAFSLLLFVLLFNKRIYSFFCQSRKLWLNVLFYILSILISSLLSISIDEHYLNSIGILSEYREYESSAYYLGIYNALTVFMYFSFIAYLNKQGKSGLFVKTFFKLFLFYCLLNDFFALVGFQINNQGYIVGNKFNVSYMHLYLAVFYCLKYTLYDKKFSRNKAFGYVIFAIVVSIVTHCSTSLVGCFLLMLFLWLKRTHLPKIFNTKSVVLLTLFSVLFPIMATYIINIPFISYIIVDVLGEDLSLTGRIGIYESLAGLMTLRPIWGFGPGSGSALMVYYTDMPNAQNGFVNYYISWGIIGFVTLIVLMITIIKKVEAENVIRHIYPIYAIVMIMIFMSTVEITIGSNFVVLLSFMLIGCENQYMSCAKSVSRN